MQPSDLIPELPAMGMTEREVACVGCRGEMRVPRLVWLARGYKSKKQSHLGFAAIPQPKRIGENAARSNPGSRPVTS